MKRNLLSIVAVQSTGNGSCFFNPASILKVGDESASDVLRALTAAVVFECRNTKNSVSTPNEKIQRDFGS